MRCQTCLWFDPMNGQTVGWCRKTPPVVIPTELETADQHGRLTKAFTAWPIVRGDDWCGQYERDDRTHRQAG